MKKIIVLILVTFTFFGCGDELEFNTPSFQGETNGNLFQANSYSANLDSAGVLTVTGTDGVESVTLSFIAPEIKTHDIGTSGSYATFLDINGVLWSTNNTPDSSVQSYPADGALELNEFDTEQGFVSGKFTFNAFNSSGLSSVNLNRGVFYRVPLTIGGPLNFYTCADAENDSATALAAFNAVDLYDHVAYEQACIVYRNALLNEMNYCGDPNHEISSILHELDANNCQLTCDQIEANTETARINYENATIGNLIEACNRYRTNLNYQIATCGDSNSGALQAIVDGLDCDDDDGDGVANTLEDINGDGDYENDDSDGDLNPDYLDTDDDDDLIPTADELGFDVDGNALDSDSDSVLNYLDTDDDNDGILTAFEVAAGDTDGDGLADNIDTDDDGDGVLTIFESADGDGDGDPSDAIDTDMDGDPNYLDLDDDGDSVHTMYENADPDMDGNPSDASDFDSNGVPDYLDNDDDGDGMLTIDEDPDPNGDGNPDDAANTDADTAPDYLDAT